MSDLTQEARQAKRHAILLMATCAGMWSIAGIFIKMIPWNPFVIAGFRSLFASAVIAIYIKAAKIPFVINKSSIVSGVMLAMTFLAFVTANKLTTAANAIVLQFTAPVFIVIISSIVYRQRFRRVDILAVVVTIFGISLCFFDQLGAGSLLGNLVGVMSGVFMAGMFVTTGNADDDSRMSGILLGQLFTALIGVPVAFFTDTPISRTAVASILVLAVVQLGIPYIFYGLAARHCPPLVCCLISALEPLLNPVWVFLFDGEAPGPSSLVGGIVVIATVTLWNIWNGKHSDTA